MSLKKEVEDVIRKCCGGQVNKTKVVDDKIEKGGFELKRVTFKIGGLNIKISEIIKEDELSSVLMLGQM